MLIAIMADAFNPKYLGYNCPFISSLADKGCTATLIPSFGFEPDAAYVAGLYPEECNGGTLYWRHPEDSPFKWTRWWSWLVAPLPAGLQIPFRRGIQVINYLKERELGRKYLARPAKIPFNHLHEFSVAHRRLMFEPGFTPTPTIFDLMTAAGKKWDYYGYPLMRGSAERIASRVCQEDLSEHELIFIMMPDLDSVGHTYGIGSAQVRSALEGLDRAVAQINEQCRRYHDEVSILIFGDHGMVDVHNTVDVMARLDHLTLSPWKDYSYFLDSTFARFWVHNPAAENAIVDILGNLDGGSLVTDADRRDYKASYGHNRFGDVVFWADGGTVISPNFFQGRGSIKGMHGYRREVADNHAALVLHHPGHTLKPASDDPMEMTGLFATFLQLLGLTTEKNYNLEPVINIL